MHVLYTAYPNKTETCSFQFCWDTYIKLKAPKPRITISMPCVYLQKYYDKLFSGITRKVTDLCSSMCV